MNVGRSHALLRIARGLLLAAAGSTAACDGLLGSDQAAFAEDAHVLVSGTSPVPLLLVTSTNFVSTLDIDSGLRVTTLILADTLVLETAEFDRHFDIFGADRFLVRLVNPDENETADVHLTIELDGRTVYNQRATMRDASLEYTAFYQPGGN